jgi:hypothetical protein
MIAWPTADLDTIGNVDEIDIAPVDADATPGRWTTIWVVRVADEMFVRPFVPRPERPLVPGHTGHRPRPDPGRRRRTRRRLRTRR